MDFRDLQFKIHHFDRLDSTNIHAHEMGRKGELGNYDVIWADYQEKGKGQRSNVWVSNPSDNLLVSIVLKLDIDVPKAYFLNKLVASIIYDLLDNMAVEGMSIKWPNDILIKGEKVCGILIENSIQGYQINQSIVGIGLNVNQLVFPDFERSATSLNKELGRQIHLRSILDALLDLFKKKLKLLFEDVEQIDELYHQRLYGKDQEKQFKIGNNEVTGLIRGVDASGQLLLEIEGEIVKFGEKELRFID